MLPVAEEDPVDVAGVEVALVEVSVTRTAEYRPAINAVDQITLPETVMQRVLNVMHVENLKDI